MNFATIGQSFISITDNLYLKEKFTEITQKSIDDLKEKQFQEEIKKQYQSNVQKLYDTKNKTIEKDYKLYTNDTDLDGLDGLDGYDKKNNLKKYKDDKDDKDDDKDDDKKKEIKMIDSVEMDNFNEQILRDKNKNAEKNRAMISQQINNINLEKQKREEKIKQREKKQKDLIDKGAWDGIKNDWYWGSNNLKKTSYSEIENSLDNLKESNYLPVPLSNEYKIMGNDETDEEKNKIQMAKPFIYQSPLKDYIYDVKNNQLVSYNNNISEKTEEANKILPTLSPTVSPTLSPTLNPTSIPTLSVKEGFMNNINVDPKLFEIYQKTLTTKKNTVSYDVDYTYNYVFVLIIIIVLFLLFKSS